MSYADKYRAIREKVAALTTDSLETIAETIVDLEDRIDDLEREVADLSKQIEEAA